jgi:hypothetical protein
MTRISADFPALICVNLQHLRYLCACNYATIWKAPRPDGIEGYPELICIFASQNSSVSGFGFLIAGAGVWQKQFKKTDGKLTD